MQRQFTAYEESTIKQVDLFKYLGRPFSNADNYVPAMRWNLNKTRGIWMGFSKILWTAEISPSVAGMFYQAVIAAVLIYG